MAENPIPSDDRQVRPFLQTLQTLPNCRIERSQLRMLLMGQIYFYTSSHPDSLEVKRKHLGER
jgi:hypothetical protein